MSSSRQPHQNPAAPGDDNGADSDHDLLAEDEIDEVLEAGDDDEDVAMDSGDDDNEQEEILLQNDSIAYFDAHKDSVFAIAQHPIYPSLIATGGSEGDADDAPGKGYVFDTSAAVSRQPVLPPSYNSSSTVQQKENTQLHPIFAIDGHTDSINTLTFTLPAGDFLVSGGLDGRVRVYAVAPPSGNNDDGLKIKFLAESQETEEINWLAPCPAPEYANTIALGASDGSVWVLTIDPSEENPIRIVQSYFLHTGACTAGAWAPDGQLLATVSEDSSLHVYDVWGAAAAQKLVTDNGQTVVSLTEADQRFAVEGGLYSVAVAPSGSFLAVGGAGGGIRIVGLPRLAQQQQPKQQQRGSAKKAAAAQPGAILASLNVQQDGIESLSFAPAPQTLLAAGSVDGSIAVFDTARSFAVRKHIQGAHDGESVVKVDFVKSPSQPAMAGWLLTSCGLDGAVRRWDLRAGATANSSQNASSTAATGVAKEWRGHRGGGEGGGVLGFVQGETGERVVTAGDDALVLVFEA
ncbi:WD40-repeat-containing domain protein [Apodospora peruviana]|uniref:WD40-repeat-containing domain protein n=1 Tax=Apodospora peruviana TaxID=516989 RepID=A0AAE0IUL4_9PEZI|nr:WD40-repeat-containing domain protein [Apodospora peruviana]